MCSNMPSNDIPRHLFTKYEIRWKSETIQQAVNDSVLLCTLLLKRIRKISYLISDFAI